MSEGGRWVESTDQVVQVARPTRRAPADPPAEPYWDRVARRRAAVLAPVDAAVWAVTTAVVRGRGLVVEARSAAYPSAARVERRRAPAVVPGPAVDRVLEEVVRVAVDTADLDHAATTTGTGERPTRHEARAR